MNEVQINKIKKRADEYATSCFPYEEQFLERETVVKCCVLVVTEIIAELEKKNAELNAQVEEMKCCGNCENRYGQEKCADCHNYSKWKFKQAEQFYEEIAE